MTLLASCGSASVVVEKTPQAHFVALANALCREAKTTKPTKASRASFIAHRKTQLALAHAFLNSAHQQPLISTYLSDVAARKRLREAVTHDPGKEPPLPDGLSPVRGGIPAFNAMYELDAKIRDDEKALGMSACIGRAPRPPIGG